MLIGNYAVINKSPNRFLAGSAVSNNRSNYNQVGAAKNKFTSTPYYKLSSVPDGTEPPNSFEIARKGGGLATFNLLNSTGTLTANLAMGLAHEAALFGSGTISAADLQLLAQLNAALVGAGTLAGTATVTVALNSSVTGAGSITADMTLITASELAANLAGAGDLVGSLQILAGMTASIIGAGSVTADATGILSMGADIDSAGDLVTAQTCAAAVWNSTAAAFNDASSMGNLQNQALTTGKFIALK